MLLKYNQGKKFKKTIHLLYVPTMYCNMACSYCYLGNLTNVKNDNKIALSTLETAVNKFLSQGYLPFNISFHGGEVTTLNKDTLESLFKFVNDYYKEYEIPLKSFGFKTKPNHIKTNLYNVDSLLELFDKYKVSISGSVDLPLKLHDKYRVYKNNKSTLPKIINNLKLLSKYKHNKKISCVVTKEHLNFIDEFIADIKYIHNDIGFDMTKFNIMFGFDSNKNIEKFTNKISGTEMLNDNEMVMFYNKLKQNFIGTDLEYGFKNYWFEEFTPSFCCSAENCGNKFFLLQSDGNVYSCPRGQSNERYKYGNIFYDDIEQIIQSAYSIIQKNENEMEIDEDCLKCEYLKYCNIGCTFVRDETKLNKSYTCALQKVLYKEEPNRYSPMTKKEISDYKHYLLFQNNIKKIINKKGRKVMSNLITNELYDNKNSLLNIIKNDKLLSALYDNSNFKISINGNIQSLNSQILKTESLIEVLSKNDEILLYINKNIFFYNAEKELFNNNIYIMCLRNTLVTYGDENRNKQEHIFDYSIYYQSLKEISYENEKYYIYDLKPILMLNSNLFKKNVLNNIFFTTKKLREYHYSKQKKNAFYHIQAINLPFPNFEFYWSENE